MIRITVETLPQTRTDHPWSGVGHVGLHPFPIEEMLTLHLGEDGDVQQGDEP